MRIDHWLLGCCDFCVKEADTAAFLNVCRAWAIPYEYQRHEDGAWHFRCRARAYAALERQLAAVDVDAHLVRRSGLPALLVRHRRRVGVLVGALVAAVVCYLASAVVWDVRIESEGGVDAVSLEETLRECGLSVGTLLPSLDTDEVESRLLTTSRDVAWVSVNIKGTVAYVQVRPLLRPEAVGSAGETVNLVAAQDGVVESVRLMAGNVVVKPGDIVRKGQLLISGVRDIREDGYSLTEARGEVMARTTHTLTVEIPLTYEQKVYTDAPMIEKTLFFFGKTIKITKNAGIIGKSCDIIKKMEDYTLFSGCVLPIAWQTVEIRPYEMTTATRTQEEAEALAYEQLMACLTLATAHATLLSRQVACEWTDEVCRLVCTYTCVENIAIPLPFTTGDSESVLER